jgi:hypothetical protein
MNLFSPVRDRATGAVAGGVAAAAWLAAVPLLKRLTRLDFSDARLLGRLLRPSSPSDDGGWRLAGTVAHIANGMVFGAAFSRLVPRPTPLKGLVVAEIENLASWPGMAVLDRWHPDRRSGYWPSLVTDRRVLVHEMLAHGLFGLVLGALARALGRSPVEPGSPNMEPRRRPWQTS